jgi:outer membrane protein TolC
MLVSSLCIAETLTLDKAIQMAISNDVWLKGSEYRQQALISQGVAANQLPDPKLSLSMANLPSDTFDFGQEGMTQLKVGINQQFPRGNTRSLKQQLFQERSEETGYQRINRQAMMKLKITHLWLEWLRYRNTIELIEQDRSLFEELADIVTISYASAISATQQQDIIQAQVELTRLDDRIYGLHEKAEVELSKLNEWLPKDDRISHVVNKRLPTIPSDYPQWVVGSVSDDKPYQPNDEQSLFSQLRNHPQVKQLDQRITASDTAIKLSKQSYSPQWGVGVSYAYRDEDPMGNSRADLISVGVSVDMPLFTANRQDKQLEAAVAESSAVKTEKILLLRTLAAQVNQASAKLQRLEQRQTLYQTRLLTEIHDQVEASLTAYTNNNGDFNRVVRGRITELNSRIDALNIDVDRLKNIAQLNYLFSGSPLSATSDTLGKTLDNTVGANQ